MKSMKKKISLIIIGILIFSLVACSSNSGKETVGISMPSKTLQRWTLDAGYMEEYLKDMGYGVEIQFAEDQVDTQLSQIENMIAKGVDVLVIAAIDGEALTDVLEKAHDANIPVIAYDRLLMNSPYVDYHVTFDNFGIGAMQGTYIEEKLELKEGKGPYNIELFGGSPDDNNAYFVNDGAMSILKPYIENGQLIVKSGQIEMDKISILHWDSDKAQERMDNLLTAYYTDDILHAVLSPNDSIAIGVISALKSAGYGSSDKPFPIITGQDAEIASVKAIIAGEQSMTVFGDTRVLAKRATEMVDAILKGEEVEVNDTETYDNNVKVVPTYLCEPISVDITNYKEVLIDSEYYTEEE